MSKKTNKNQSQGPHPGRGELTMQGQFIYDQSIDFLTRVKKQVPAMKITVIVDEHSSFSVGFAENQMFRHALVASSFGYGIEADQWPPSPEPRLITN
jgi:hypothetical protein